MVFLYLVTNTTVNAGVLVGFNRCENECCGLHDCETVCIGRNTEVCIPLSVLQDGESRFTTVLLPIVRANLSCARRLNTRCAF
jgi:hypothetical protein